MSYQLRHSQKLGDNLRRICRKQIEAAIEITKGEKKSNDTPVHQVRKHLKKARAALRLMRKEIGRGLFREQDCILRDIGRLTSEIRDAEVRLQTVQQFQGIKQRRRHGRGNYSKLEGMLMLELENFMAAFAEWQTQALPMLEKACANIDCWPLDQFSCKQLRRAVQRSYKDARRALKLAEADPTPENFHRFRTRAKRLWYELRILRPINPVVLRNLSDDLRSLGNLLGRAHDLSFLGDRLRREDRSGNGRMRRAGQPAWEREGHNLLALIEVSQGDLQRGATELAEHFFAERPRDFGERLAGWLDDWEHKTSHSVAEALVK
jgi:CHAD domain-containing protein